MIDLEKKKQHTLTSAKLKRVHAPCFINGAAEFLAVGGWIDEGVEIWDIQNKSSIKCLKVDTGRNYIGSLASTSNILAVGTGSRKLQLWDVRNWEKFHSMDMSMQPQSVHLTNDAKYLTIGGCEGEYSIVLEIQ